MCYIQRKNDDGQRRFVSGASLIAPGVLLTTAHYFETLVFHSVSMIFREFLHNTLHTLHTLIYNITQCVLGDISKSHISNVSKTHWQFQCVLWNIEFKYIIFSITHWHSQCVLETFMYLKFVFLWTHWDSHFKYKVIIQMSITHWNH